MCENVPGGGKGACNGVMEFGKERPRGGREPAISSHPSWGPAPESSRTRQDETVFTAAATLLRDRDAKHPVSADRSGSKGAERVGSRSKGAYAQENGVVHKN